MKMTLLAAVIATFTLIGCGEKQASETIDSAVIANPISADNAAELDPDKLPQMTFDKEFHDFGKITAGEKVTYSFKFTNTGKADLIISTAAGSCGCTVPEFPKEPIKPGKTGFIKVQFNSEGRSGIQEKQVTIVANTIPNTNELKIRSEVITN
jgi:hypothetical protein